MIYQEQSAPDLQPLLVIRISSPDTPKLSGINTLILSGRRQPLPRSDSPKAAVGWFNEQLIAMLLQLGNHYAANVYGMRS